MRRHSFSMARCPMDELVLIGIGTGSPDHLTREGEAEIRSADCILVPRKGAAKAELAELKKGICASVLGERAESRVLEFDMPVRASCPDYFESVDAWHGEIGKAWNAALAARDVQRVALLVWGDPSLYDSTLRIAARLRPAPLVRVVPGITALQALTAAHAIPLNDVNAPVTITTGRRLREEGWPEGAETVAVMLDGELSFRHLDPSQLHVWWGAYLGMKDQVLASGPLAEVAERIAETRAAARDAHGWIMDTYLLKRSNRGVTSGSNHSFDAISSSF